jgi:subtilisin family serine protease
MSRSVSVAALLLAMSVALPGGALAAEAAAPKQPYIVVLQGGGDAGDVVAVAQAAKRNAAAIDHVATRNTVAVERRFEHLLAGFSAELSPGQVQALAADPDVAAIVPDEPIELASQSMPTGVARIGGRTSPAARIDGIDERVDADVAVVDTGIDAAHPDLNVAGGINCSTADRTAWGDANGHGTHVAGTIAAKDNDIGVVGVAPGARLWAVRILDADGSGLLSWYICGLDWIAAQRDPSDSSRPLFEAVNMSVAKWGTDDGACGSTNSDILHAAICRLVASGVTVAAAAANDAGPAAKRVPAAYDEVITVSALADTDGKPGGLGGDKCWSWGGYDVDDTFADFSNYGPDVDLIAPGKCIWSTKPGNTYGWLSGTSMAAPHVTGAVAIYKATRPGATPAEVKRALGYLGSTNWASGTDPDGVPDRLLDVSRIGPMGSVSMSASPAVVSVTNAGGSVPVTLILSRPTVLEELKLSVTGIPAGMTASLDTAALFGFEATNATLTVTVPKSFPLGTYSLTVRANWHATLATATVPVIVTSLPVTRLAGADRYATSAAISRATYAPGVPVAYIATGLGFADALSGAPAAALQGGPLLLVRGTSIPSVVATELARLQPGRIVVLGGTSVVSAGVASALDAYVAT